jgi:type II secretory pathway component PulK
VKEVARAVLANTLSAEDVDELLHGKQEKDWQLRKSSFSLKQLADVLEARGYKVLARRVQNYRAVVTVQRP